MAKKATRQAPPRPRAHLTMADIPLFTKGNITIFLGIGGILASLFKFYYITTATQEQIQHTILEHSTALQESSQKIDKLKDSVADLKTGAATISGKQDALTDQLRGIATQLQGIARK
jgi:septal ring factor EnvC (AmiA/AmiB activator)